MERKLRKTVEILRKASVGSYTLAAVLSVLADLLIKMIIPGGGLLEAGIAIIAAIAVFITVIMQKEESEGLIQSLHNAF